MSKLILKINVSDKYHMRQVTSHIEPEIKQDSRLLQPQLPIVIKTDVINYNRIWTFLLKFIKSRLENFDYSEKNGMFLS